jgi:magnesium chelatase family protein
VCGIYARIRVVEVVVAGMWCFVDYCDTVVLPEAAGGECRVRVRAALKNCGYDFPPTHITINLAPADIR